MHARHLSESECSAGFSDEGPENEIKRQKTCGDEYRHKKNNAGKRAMYWAGKTEEARSEVKTLKLELKG